MKCEKCRELRLAAERTAAEEAELEQHLAECAACRAEAAKEAAIWQALRSLPEEELPAGYHAELMQKLRAEQKVLPLAAQKKRVRWKQLSLIAAAVLLVVAAGGLNGILEMRQNTTIPTAQMEFAMDTTQKETAPTPTADMDEIATSVETMPKKAETAQAKISAAAEPTEDAAVSMQAAEEGEAMPFAARGAVRIQAAERLSLAVAAVADARTAILDALAALDGYEEAADAADLLYAVVPMENVAQFKEELAALGNMEEVESIPAQENDAFRVLEIQLLMK